MEQEIEQEKRKEQGYIDKITNIRPHDNADRLEVATVRGWNTVVPRGIYKEGQNVVFVEIDSLLPRKPWNEFLFKGDDDKKDKFRVRNAKFRGQPSQGIVFPFNIVEEFLECDGDVDDWLGIEKYEKPIPACLAGITKGGFPIKYINKTDETNLLSVPQLLDELEDGDELVATLKMDGSSCTVILDEYDELIVCSRNLNLTETEGNSFWKVVRELDLETKLKNFKQNLCNVLTTIEEKDVEPFSIVLQGELVGEGIQGNPQGIKGHDLYLFNAKACNEYYNNQILTNLANHLGVKIAPVVDIPQEDLKHPVKLFTLTQHASGVKYDNGKPAEGLVFRIKDSTRLSRRLNKPWSGKIINPNYKD